MKVGVVTFPGSNCDRDCAFVWDRVLGQDVRMLWHEAMSLGEVDLVILPGGFSYGDYLRVGAIARFSPIMTCIKQFAETGGLVLGICNGFQILLELGLLPGAMLPNRDVSFICEDAHLTVERCDTVFSNQCRSGRVLRIPIAHADGNYYADEDTLRSLDAQRQILFRYCSSDGHVEASANPNGSCGNIAGICNRAGNVLGMMPHPERCAESLLGHEDGLMIFRSILSAVETGAANASQEVAG